MAMAMVRNTDMVKGMDMGTDTDMGTKAKPQKNNSLNIYLLQKIDK